MSEETKDKTEELESVAETTEGSTPQENDSSQTESEDVSYQEPVKTEPEVEEHIAAVPQAASYQPEPEKETQKSSGTCCESHSSMGSFFTVGVVFLSLIVGIILIFKQGDSVMAADGNVEAGFTSVFSSAMAQKDGVAVVRVYGPIQTGSSSSEFFPDPNGADQVIARLRKLGKNEHVKAIVLRINSPGGTVGSVQEIHRELMRLKDKGIKIVASMADVCASGGVYLACAADKVFANRGTITGSVGVIFSVHNLTGLMEKVGVSVNSITSGKYKDIGSYARLMRDDEKKLLQDIVDSTYDQFLSAVADGRNLDKEMVRTWADGRIFNGEQALKYKLVDEIGALQDALKSAQKLAGLEELHIIKETSHPLDQINSMFGTAIRNVLPFRASILDTQAPLLYFYQPGN